MVEPVERSLPRASPQGHVEEIGCEHVGQAVLAQADQLPRTAELEVALGKLEAAVGRGHRGEALRAFFVDPALEE